MASSGEKENSPARSSAVLALIPLGVGIVLGGLMLPRATPPDDVPIPRVDMRSLERTEADDRALAASAEIDRLSADVRAAGEAIRAFNGFEAHDDADAPWVSARVTIDDKVAIAWRADNGKALTALRAVQLARFVDEVHAYQQSGAASPELDALGGGFLQQMRIAGWLDGRTLAMDDHVLRVAFKLKWNATAGLDTHAELGPTLDESRALYTFYLTHPHPQETTRFSIEAARRTARTQADCDALAEGQRMASERWRVEKIDKLAKLDPAYPADYARGVGEYRAGRYEASARAFQQWLDAHPDGNYSLRAKNHLRAAMAMTENDR